MSIQSNTYKKMTNTVDAETRNKINGNTGKCSKNYNRKKKVKISKENV